MRRIGVTVSVAVPKDRKSTRLNSSHANISYAVFCLKKKIDTVFFFNDTATTEIYTLSLHDALPISPQRVVLAQRHRLQVLVNPIVERQVLVRHLSGYGSERILERELDAAHRGDGVGGRAERSEEHTSELQSRQYLVCRLLLEKKNRHCFFF